MKCLAVSLSGCDSLMVCQDKRILPSSCVLQIILSSPKLNSKVVQFILILALYTAQKNTVYQTFSSLLNSYMKNVVLLCLSISHGCNFWFFKSTPLHMTCTPWHNLAYLFAILAVPVISLWNVKINDPGFLFIHSTTITSWICRKLCSHCYNVSFFYNLQHSSCLVTMSKLQWHYFSLGETKIW
jgi:hypothetical protein